MYHVYVLRSIKDGKRYIGQTNRLDNRIALHNKGLVKSTRSRRPFTLIYKEVFQTESAALSRERFFKTHKGYNTLKKLGIYGGD